MSEAAALWQLIGGSGLDLQKRISFWGRIEAVESAALEKLPALCCSVKHVVSRREELHGVIASRGDPGQSGSEI